MSDDFVLSSVTFVPPEALVDLYDSVRACVGTRPSGPHEGRGRV